MTEIKHSVASRSSVIVHVIDNNIDLFTNNITRVINEASEYSNRACLSRI